MQYMKLDAPIRQELLQDLAAMPAYIRHAFSSVAAADLAKPGPDGMFSPVEQVWHLADLEVEGFGYRIQALRSLPNPMLPDFDGTAVAISREYKCLSLEEGLQRFEDARRENLKRLRSVTDTQWQNSGMQDGVGTVSLCDMPIFLRQHDRAHMEEIRVWFHNRMPVV
jgi:hypothetical protein